MRMMLKFLVPVEHGNAALKVGTLPKTVETIMARLKPEAAYFAPINGMRAGMLFFDMADTSQLVAEMEPLFLKLNAHVEVVPVMNGDDLRRGFSKMEG